MPAPRKSEPQAACEVEVDSLLALVDEQDVQMRALLAKAMNLCVSPGAETAPAKEKLDRLRRPVKQLFPGNCSPSE